MMKEFILFLIIICPTVVVVACVVCCIIHLFFKQSRVLKSFGEDLKYLKHPKEITKRWNLKLYKFEEIKLATIDFHVMRLIGEGGLCKVYKGTLTGRVVAVKRLKTLSSDGLAQLENEVELLEGLQHKNVVSLIGYCCHEQELMLVYEFLHNHNLEHFLSDETSKVLNWNERYNIIKGVADGLLYLHSGARKTVIHKDLSCSNILLDETMSPLICDFGAARCFAGMGDQSGVTEHIFATRGYADPETFQGKYSTKTDVFSFGVVVLRILSGRRTLKSPSERITDTTSTPDHITTTAWDMWKEGKMLMFRDTKLNDDYAKAEFERAFLIALWCVQEDASCRPEMLRVVDMLNRNLMPENPIDHPPLTTDIMQAMH